MTITTPPAQTRPGRVKPSDVDVFTMTRRAGSEDEHSEYTPDPEEVTSWSPTDLTEALEGKDIPAPQYLPRIDGKALLYAGRIHYFIGEPESCKTWAALLAVAERLNAGGWVLWIDYEDDERGIVARLRALGVSTEAMRTRLHYIRPEEPLMTSNGKATAGNAELGRLLETFPYELAVIDGVTEGMVTEGLDPIGTGDAAAFSRRLAKRIAAAPSSPAVVSLDHVAKSSEARGRWAIGSQHKIAGLTGAAFVFEVRKALSRATHEPVAAEIMVKVSKDRPGHVRAIGLGADQLRPVAVLELTAYPDGGVTGRLVPPEQATGTPPLDLLRDIVHYLTTYPGSTGTKVRENVEGKDQTIVAALRWMVAEGYATVEKAGRSHYHTLTEAADDFR